MIRLVYAEWGTGECRAAFRALLPWSLASRQFSDHLIARVAPLLANRPLFPVNRGRTALALALAAFRERAPDRDEVVIPAYICPSVVETVRSLGLSIVLVDVREDLNVDPEELGVAVGRRTLAVIAAHMYGRPAEIGTIERYCRDEGVFLVDDAAQVVGASCEGRPLGTFGDAGLVSFSQSKTIATGAENAGGLLIANNQDLLASIERRWRDLPNGTGQLRDLLIFLRDYRWESLTEQGTYLVGELLRRFGGSVASRPIERHKMTPVAAALALEQLATLESRLTGRRRVIKRFYDNIAQRDGITVPQYCEGIYLTRLLLLMPPHTSQAAIRRRLRAAGVQTRRGYDASASNRDYPLPRAQDLAPRLIEVPSHSQMSDATVDRICDIIFDAIAAEARTPPQRLTGQGVAMTRVPLRTPLSHDLSSVKDR
jgi:dTDP-4-amino-4,6-dideoxygalactose transaminase